MKHMPTIEWIDSACDTYHYQPGKPVTVKRGTGAGFCTNCGYDIQVLKDQSAENVTCELCNKPTVMGIRSYLFKD